MLGEVMLHASQDVMHPEKQLLRLSQRLMLGELTKCFMIPFQCQIVFARSIVIRFMSNLMLASFLDMMISLGVFSDPEYSDFGFILGKISDVGVCIDRLMFLCALTI